MAEYIDRKALLQEIEKLKRLHNTCYPSRHFVVSDIMACIYNTLPADVVEVVRCQNCIHSEPFERNCELNSTAYMQCTIGRGEEMRNVWHKYQKFYKDYSVVDRDGYCDEGERRNDA